MGQKQLIFNAFFFFIFLVVGVLIAQHTWHGKGYIRNYSYEEGERSLAAIRPMYDFSHLQGGALELASKNRLIEGAKILRANNNDFGIELGHFVVKDASGHRAFACSSYQKVRLEFEAIGYAVNGEKGKLLISGSCRIAKDASRIAPIWIPVAKVLNENPGEIELDYWGENPVSIKFENIFDQWPSRWVLQKVQLENEEGQIIEVSAMDLTAKLSKPFTMNWNVD